MDYERERVNTYILLRVTKGELPCLFYLNLNINLLSAFVMQERIGVYAISSFLAKNKCVL